MKNDTDSVFFRQQIPRWIVASIMKMCDTTVKRFNPGKVKLILESDWTTEAIKQNPELIVANFDGPDIRKLGKYQQRYLINYTLISSTHNRNNDMYAHQRTHGVALECFPACIPVFRYGDGSLDNGQQLGVLEQVNDPTTFGHGTPGNDIPVYQSSVSAQYRMDYSEE
jgi:hypothetical protein